jgi:hypothetical protein
MVDHDLVDKMLKGSNARITFYLRQHDRPLKKKLLWGGPCFTNCVIETRKLVSGVEERVPYLYPVAGSRAT